MINRLDPTSSSSNYRVPPSASPSKKTPEKTSPQTEKVSQLRSRFEQSAAVSTPSQVPVNTGRKLPQPKPKVTQTNRPVGTSLRPLPTPPIAKSEPVVAAPPPPVPPRKAYVSQQPSSNSSSTSSAAVPASSQPARGKLRQKLHDKKVELKEKYHEKKEELKANRAERKAEKKYDRSLNDLKKTIAKLQLVTNNLEYAPEKKSTLVRIPEGTPAPDKSKVYQTNLMSVSDHFESLSKEGKTAFIDYNIENLSTLLRIPDRSNSSVHKRLVQFNFEEFIYSPNKQLDINELKPEVALFLQSSVKLIGKICEKEFEKQYGEGRMTSERTEAFCELMEAYIRDNRLEYMFAKNSNSPQSKANAAASMVKLYVNQFR